MNEPGLIFCVKLEGFGDSQGIASSSWLLVGMASWLLRHPDSSSIHFGLRGLQATRHYLHFIDITDELSTVTRCSSSCRH
jgi:hypothetical protein